MERNIIKRVWNAILNNEERNKFNDAFLYQFGGGYTTYDVNNETYLNKGYNYNSVVFSVINQQSTKTASIPVYIRKIEDEKSKKKLKRYKHLKNLKPQQQIKKLLLESKAYSDEELELPLLRPNPTQTWAELFSLFKTFIATTGNVYFYLLAPKEGINKGKPIAIYVLPSDKVQIVLKDKANLLGLESPVKSYILIEGKTYIEFEAENVIHVKLSNPNYDESGAHLYGQSRLKAALRNIQSSNTAVDQNNKALKNGGAFGFIHGKNIPLQEGQAKEIKERLNEMNNNPDNLAKIAGISAEIGFTRLALTTDELKPFDYLSFDEKQICNVLGWSDKLLNNDSASTYNNIEEERQRVITDNIYPDLLLLEDAFNNQLLPRFKGYENTEIVFDISELPEMQQDTKLLVEWGVLLLDRGVINRNELRELVNFNKLEDSDMEVHTVTNDLLTLNEAIQSDFNING